MYLRSQQTRLRAGGASSHCFACSVLLLHSCTRDVSGRLGCSNDFPCGLCDSFRVDGCCCYLVVTLHGGRCRSHHHHCRYYGAVIVACLSCFIYVFFVPR